MRYIIFVIDGPGNPANADEMKHIDAFNEKLQNNGHWIMAAGIQQASGATLIDNRNNKNLVEQASLFTGADSYSGFWIIEADSDEEANFWGAKIAQACGWPQEIRKFKE